MASSYGDKLNPDRHLRTPLGVRGKRQTVVITNNPSTIDASQQLLVRFPNLGANDVIVPGTARLSFTISLDSTDVNRTVVQNLGRAVVKKLTIKISGNEVMSIDDSDLYYIYTDLWRSWTDRASADYQGIDTSLDRNTTKLRVGAADGNDGVPEDNAIANAYENRFYIPLDFELLESHMPYLQNALQGRLEYELTFNDYSRVIEATADPAASYTIDNISLEYEMVTNPEIARLIRNQYANRVAILYDRVLRLRKVVQNKSDSVWNFNINTPAKSMKGILILCEEAPITPYARDSEKFYNPKIDKVELTIEGVPNQLFAQGMRSYQQWDEAKKLFAGGSKLPPDVSKVARSLDLHDMYLGAYLTNKYALWLDLRTTDDNELHGSGRRVENGSEGITLQITKTAEAPGALNVYIFIVMDAQLTINNGNFESAVY